MNFIIKNITPEPIAEYLKHNHYKSDIWQQNFELLPNKKYLISAQSGKGKSTFAHLLYGLRNDYTGEIFLVNENNPQKNLKNLSLEEWGMLRQKKISMVFQDLRLFLELTALENIILKNELTNVFSLEEIKELAKKLNILHILDHKTATLSYGERQRVAILRALAQPFSYLLLDEPFSHLDNQNIDIAKNMILYYLQKNNATLLMTSLGGNYDIVFDKVFNL